MNEEGYFKELFGKVDLHYSTDGIEDAVLKEIKSAQRHRKSKNIFSLISKIGFFLLILLSLQFMLSVSKSDTLYLYLASPIILYLLLFPLDILLFQKVTKKARL